MKNAEQYFEQNPDRHLNHELADVLGVQLVPEPLHKQTEKLSYQFKKQLSHLQVLMTEGKIGPENPEESLKESHEYQEFKKKRRDHKKLQKSEIEQLLEIKYGSRIFDHMKHLLTDYLNSARPLSDSDYSASSDLERNLIPLKKFIYRFIVKLTALFKYSILTILFEMETLSFLTRIRLRGNLSRFKNFSESVKKNIRVAYQEKKTEAKRP